MIIGFLAQAFFIRILGAEYLGLNGLFSNILTMLSIFELGIGSAIIFNLYQPIASNNIDEIKSLMKFYKKSYRIIALVILLFGLFIIPFLPYIVGTVSIDVNIPIIYILFLLSTVSSYILAYKRSLIYAYQKNYIINYTQLGRIILLNVLQILILYFTRNYYLYLGLKIVLQLLENIVLSVLADQLYPYLNDKNVTDIDPETSKNIFRKIKALFFHKVGSIIVLGTDNIIISSFLGVVTVGLYSNYYMIINAVNVLFAEIITSTVPSVGNLLVTNDSSKSFQVFRKIRFFNFWIACFSAICILVLIQPFIILWVGEEYLLGFGVLCVLVINFYQKMMRRTYGAFKDAAGIWEEDKYIPLVESVLNIVFSILMLKIFGLAGVFLGTIFSGFILWCYSYPKLVYKKLFHRSYWDYAKETLSYFFLFLLLAVITYLIASIFVFENIFLQLTINLIVCFIIPNIILIVIFYYTENFQYFYHLIQKMVRRGKTK